MRIIHHDLLTLAIDGDYVGVAIRSTKDRINKRKGNMIARGRLRKGKEKGINIYIPKNRYYTKEDVEKIIVSLTKERKK